MSPTRTGDLIESGATSGAANLHLATETESLPCNAIPAAYRPMVTPIHFQEGKIKYTEGLQGLDSSAFTFACDSAKSSRHHAGRNQLHTGVEGMTRPIMRTC